MISFLSELSEYSFFSFIVLRSANSSAKFGFLLLTIQIQIAPVIEAKPTSDAPTIKIRKKIGVKIVSVDMGIGEYGS